MYRRKKNIDTFNRSNRMLIRFVAFQIFNQKGLYVRIPVIDTTVQSMRGIVRSKSHTMLELLYPVIGTAVQNFVK